MERNIFIAMNKRDRRAFLQTSAGVLAASLRPAAFSKVNLGVIPDGDATGADSAQTAPSGGVNEGRKPLRLGLILGVGEDPDSSMAKVHDLGLPTCQARSRSRPGFPQNACTGLGRNRRTLCLYAGQ